MQQKTRPRDPLRLLTLFVALLALVSTAGWLLLDARTVGGGAFVPTLLFSLGLGASLLIGVGSVAVVRAAARGAAAPETPSGVETRSAATAGAPFIDALTGIASRAWFDWTLAVEIQRSRRYGHPLSVLVVDMDRFAELKGARGEAAGDYVLMTVAAILRSRVRQTDQAAHLQGGEFAVVASETDEKGAFVAAEKLRRAVELYPFDENLEVTISIGVTGLVDSDTAAAFLQRAEAAAAAVREKKGNSVALAAH